MGCFDEVRFTCPKRGCGGTVEMQSKAGACTMASYNAIMVPPEIAVDLDGQSAICPKCDNAFKVQLATGIDGRLPMIAVVP